MFRTVCVLFLLALPGVQAALLQDATGDVQGRHFDLASTPLVGWGAMDLVSLELEELPDVIRFTVTAAGLEGTWDYDAGNYFVYVARGERHYTIRMYQDNQGTAVISDLHATEGRSVFGPLIANLEAHVDASAGTITTDVPREYLVDQDGAVPARGGVLDQIVVSAEAHATGLYTDGFAGLQGGPFIISDRMPDDWASAEHPPANYTFLYGGGARQGPVEIELDRAFRASNGEATIYVYRVTVTNAGNNTDAFNLLAESLPPEWELRFPGNRIQLDAGESSSFDAYLRVPFQHVHGATMQADMRIQSERDPNIWASTQFGVHYLATAQPSGHHPTSYLHSAAMPGLAPLQSAFGGGDTAMFWNTLEEDPEDQGLPMSGVATGTGFAWSGCLSPGLALGLTANQEPGTAQLTLQSSIPMDGTLTGTLSVVERERGAYCHDAGAWAVPRTPVARLEPVTASLSGATSIETLITAAFNGSIPYQSGTDLVLELTFTPDTVPGQGDLVDLLPGGQLELPLLDYHEPAPVVLPGDNGTVVAAPEAFVEAPEPAKESPGVGLAALLALGATALVAARRRI